MMTIKQMKELLEGIEGYATKVTYWQWKVGEAPPLPFICFFANSTNEFAADNENYSSFNVYSVEFYSEHKDPTQEALIESALKDNDLFYRKESVYLSDENVWETIYTVEG